MRSTRFAVVFRAAMDERAHNQRDAAAAIGSSLSAVQGWREGTVP